MNQVNHVRFFESRKATLSPVHLILIVWICSHRRRLGKQQCSLLLNRLRRDLPTAFACLSWASPTLTWRLWWGLLNRFSLPTSFLYSFHLSLVPSVLHPVIPAFLLLWLPTCIPHLRACHSLPQKGDSALHAAAIAGNAAACEILTQAGLDVNLQNTVRSLRINDSFVALIFVWGWDCLKCVV